MQTVNKCQTHTKSTLGRVVTWSHPSPKLEAPAPAAKASRLLGLAAGLVGAEKALYRSEGGSFRREEGSHLCKGTEAS